MQVTSCLSPTLDPYFLVTPREQAGFPLELSSAICYPLPSLVSALTLSVLASACPLEPHGKRELQLCGCSCHMDLWGIFLINDCYGRPQLTEGAATLRRWS